MAAPQLCAVTIGGECFLLPLKKGTLLLEILGGAQPLDRTYGLSRPHWRARPADAVRLDITVVRPGDIDASEIVSRPRAAARLLLAGPGGRT
ncbi:MAG: hypothetical protein QHC89_01755 [Bosea sp. (in: a-proteobacteria)]|nr:hypothetical protein [Bosea sp. (in: a-proteobacteria)]